MSYYAFSSGNICQNMDLFPSYSDWPEWLNTSGVLTPAHNSPATNNFYPNPSSSPTAVLWVRDFRLNIPINTNILGISANVIRESNTYGSVRNNTALMTFPYANANGFSWTNYLLDPPPRAYWANYITGQLFGNSTHLWNRTWTSSEVNSPYFGFGLAVEGLWENGDIASVYQVEVIVYYEFKTPIIIYPSGGVKVSNRLNSSVYSFNSSYVGVARVKTNGAANVLLKYNFSISGGAKFGGQASEAINKIYSEISSGGAEFGGQASEFVNIISLVEIKIGGLIDSNIITNNIVESNGLYLSGKATNEVIFEHNAYGGLSSSGNSSIGISQEIFGGILINGLAEISITASTSGGSSINGDIEIFANYNIDEEIFSNGIILSSVEINVSCVTEYELFGGSILSGESEFFEIFNLNPESGLQYGGEAEVIYSGLLFGGMSISGEAEVVLEMMTPIDSNGISISGEIDIQYNALIDIESYGVFNAPLSVRSIESIVLGGCNVGGSYYGNTLYNLGVVLGSCFLNGSNQNNQTFNHPPDFGGIIVFARFRPSYLRYYEKRNLKICLSLNSETICNKVIPDPKKTIMNKTGYDQDIATNMFQVEISSGWCDFNDSCQNAYLPAIVKNRQGKYLPEKSRRYSIEGQIATMN